MQTKDFKGQDLRGKSFKNQNLTGADFSDCDLRGVDFSFANLTDAKFCNARMGRTLKVSFSLLLLQLLIGVFVGFTNIISNFSLEYMSKSILEAFTINSDISHIIFIMFFICLCIVAFLRAINHKRLDYLGWFFTLMLTIAVAAVIAVSINLITKSNEVKAIDGYKATVVYEDRGSHQFKKLKNLLDIIKVGVSIVLAFLVIGTATIGVLLVALTGVVTGVIAGVVPAVTFIAISMTNAETRLLIVATSSIMYSILGIYLGKRSINREEFHLLFLRELSLKIVCFSSSKFAFSILKNTDFSEVDLKYVNFKNAKISQCYFQQAKNHHLALTDGTLIEPRKVRDLVIDGIITDKNFATLDLRGLDFSNLNLQDFDFSHANLSGANLSHTQMTGATLEGWNIDTETRLDDIDCRYYYYLENGAKKRMPPKGEEYSAGEFTRIFQKIANTIDFIAHNEMELAAIKLSVEQVRVESGNDDIRVQAIEEKDGFIVVKVTVPKTEDRGVLYHEVNVLKQDYETKIQGLMTEKHIQIGKIEVLKEQLKEQRDDFLAAIKEGKIINTTNYVEGNMSGGNMAGHDMVISTEAELRKI